MRPLFSGETEKITAVALSQVGLALFFQFYLPV